MIHLSVTGCGLVARINPVMMGSAMTRSGVVSLVVTTLVVVVHRPSGEAVVTGPFVMNRLMVDEIRVKPRDDQPSGGRPDGEWPSGDSLTETGPVIQG